MNLSRVDPGTAPDPYLVRVADVMVRILGHVGDLARKLRRLPQVIRIEEAYELPVGHANASVARRADPAIGLIQVYQAAPVRGEYITRGVRGSIVYYV